MTVTTTPSQLGGTVTGAPLLILRLEGAVLFAAAVAGYTLNGGSWVIFAALILVPDLFMLGYLIDKRRGAMLYNLGHTTALPALLIAGGLTMGSGFATAVGLIWLAHIGFDRAVGFGLKYADSFKHSHLGTP